MRRGRAVVLAGLVAVSGCGARAAPVRTSAAPLAVVRRPSSADPLRVLLVGDGVMFDAAPAISAALAASGPVRVTAYPVFGFGLTRPEWYDWRRAWPPMVAQLRPDLVVLMVGPWDTRTVAAGAPGTAGWARWYSVVADRAAGVLTAGGARLVWVGMPWVGRPGSAPRVAALDAVLGRVPAAVARTWFVDTRRLLAGPHGGYAAVQPAIDGGKVRVMKPDGEHLCPDGAARIGDAVAGRVGPVFGLGPADGWEAGDWRHDQRYSWAPGGGCPPA
jgi:uncharacterized protein